MLYRYTHMNLFDHAFLIMSNKNTIKSIITVNILSYQKKFDIQELNSFFFKQRTR